MSKEKLSNTDLRTAAQKMYDDRLKFRVWDRENERYLPTCDIAIDGDLKVYLWDREHDEWLWYSGDPLIEQCTGLKDKNGRLIYEGDVILAYWGKNITPKNLRLYGTWEDFGLKDCLMAICFIFGICTVR